MQKFNKLPNYVKLIYILNNQTGWYLLNEKSNSNFELLPTELKTAPAMQPFLIKQGATEILRGRQQNNKQFFTGLRKTSFENIFTGDNRDDRPSLIICDFSHDKTKLTIVYIGGYKVYPSYLNGLIARFRKEIINSNN